MISAIITNDTTSKWVEGGSGATIKHKHPLAGIIRRIRGAQPANGAPAMTERIGGDKGWKRG